MKVLELQEKLEDEEVEEEKVEEECERLREKLTKHMEREKNSRRPGGGKRVGGKGLKSYQVHELAEAKERESERLRRALGLKPSEISENGEHPMARQEKRKREKEEPQGKIDTDDQA